MGSASLQGLRWRIKDSFVSYVLGNAGGRYSLGGGAQLLADRHFAFPYAHDGTSGFDGPRFAGFVTFRAHGGMLNVRVAAPALRQVADRIELTLDFDGGAVAIATLEEVAVGAWIGAIPRITEAGRGLFGDAYEVGEPLDRLEAWMA